MCLLRMLMPKSSYFLRHATRRALRVGALFSSDLSPETHRPLNRRSTTSWSSPQTSSNAYEAHAGHQCPAVRFMGLAEATRGTLKTPKLLLLPLWQSRNTTK